MEGKLKAIKQLVDALEELTGKKISELQKASVEVEKEPVGMEMTSEESPEMAKVEVEAEGKEEEEEIPDVTDKKARMKAMKPFISSMQKDLF